MKPEIVLQLRLNREVFNRNLKINKKNKKNNNNKKN